MSELIGVDKDVAKDPDGALVLGVGLEDLGGPFDFLVVAWKWLLYKFHDLFCCEIVEIDVWIHDVEIITPIYYY